jgi:two-component system cell cycle sensor histidine kinase/response regulator CckA
MPEVGSMSFDRDDAGDDCGELGANSPRPAIADILTADVCNTQSVQLKQLAIVGHLAGGIAHDVNNMLSAVAAFCELARDSLPSGSLQIDDLNQALLAVARATEMNRRLLAYCRPPTPCTVPTDLSEAVKRVERWLKVLLGDDVDLQVDLQPGGLFCGDPIMLEQVVINLVLNARDAMPNGGVLSISSALVSIESETGDSGVELPPGSYARLTISDTGTGMTTAVKEKIFEPFFTTKSAKLGTGLGLAIASEFVKASHGTILVHSRLGRGTTFSLYWPCTSAAENRVTGPR